MNPNILFPGLEAVMADLASIKGNASLLCDQLAIKVADSLVNSTTDPVLYSKIILFNVSILILFLCLLIYFSSLILQAIFAPNWRQGLFLALLNVFWQTPLVRK